MPASLVFAMASHVVITAALYALLTVARAPAVWSLGARQDGTNPWASLEPRISANLSNQFEWPLLFYVAGLLLILQHSVGSIPVVLAWVFVAGRVVHSLVQILTTSLRLRGTVFMVNFLAVLGMWVCVLVAV